MDSALLLQFLLCRDLKFLGIFYSANAPCTKRSHKDLDAQQLYASFVCGNVHATAPCGVRNDFNLQEADDREATVSKDVLNDFNQYQLHHLKLRGKTSYCPNAK